MLTQEVVNTQVDIAQIPRNTIYRPDFMAPGPHIAVMKDKPLSFESRPESDNRTTGDDDDDFARYRFYESDKILGKLYRAIDEREVFASVQQQGQRGGGGGGCVLGAVWTYLRRRCMGIQWDHHIERARGIRDEYVSCTTY
jgi:hypothetical protein